MTSKSIVQNKKPTKTQNPKIQTVKTKEVAKAEAKAAEKAVAKAAAKAAATNKKSFKVCLACLFRIYDFYK